MSLTDFALVRPHRVGAGPPVVLLHGLDATRHVWDGLASLTTRFTLLSFDLPGHGETPDAAADVDMMDMADLLAALLTSAEVERTHLVGVGAGGMIAQAFAAGHPHRVDRLVLCDSTPALDEGARDALLTRRDGGRLHAAAARADLMDLAEEIFAPTLVLCADGADLGTREGADFLARSIPGARLAFVPDAGSDCVRDRPAWVARVLLDFLG